MRRKAYIKPSLLQLDFSTDVEVVSFGSCKSASNTQGQGFATGETCATSGCNSVSDS